MLSPVKQRFFRIIFSVSLLLQPIIEAEAGPIPTPLETTTLDTVVTTVPCDATTDTTDFAGSPNKPNARPVIQLPGDPNKRCIVVDEEQSRDTKDYRLGLQTVYFLTRNNSVVLATSGNKALLPCTVRNLCDGTISWIRRRDYNLLTVGPNTYAGDERFQTMHSFNTDDWALQIKFVTLRDAGWYECQVTSHPPHSILILLKVLESRVEINGPTEKYLKVGTSLDLVCTVIDTPDIPEFIFWYHNERMINYDKGGGINVTSDLPNKKSYLGIAKATKAHSGNYSCVTSNAPTESTVLHILNGSDDENPAAMHTGGFNVRGWNFLTVSFTAMLIFFVGRDA